MTKWTKWQEVGAVLLFMAPLWFPFLAWLINP